MSEVKITETQVASGPQTETKTISFEGSVPALDKFVGTPAQETQQEQAPVTETTTEDPEKKSGIRKMVDETEKPAEEQKTEEAKPADPNTPAAETETKDTTEATTPDDDGEVDLNELVIDYNGQEKSVMEVVNELATANQEAQAAKDRLAQIEKDEFLKNFIDHYMNGGNVDAYLEAKAVDYEKQSDLDILKRKFEKDHADFSEKHRELLWKKKLRDDYKVGVDPSDVDTESEEYQIAQALMERDAKVARQSFKDEQAKFKIADRKAEEPKSEKPAYDPEAQKQKLLKVKEVEAFTKNKLLTLGVTDDAGNAFGFEPPDPDGIIEMMVNDGKFWNQFAKDGKVDYNKLMKTYAFSQDPDGYEKQLVEFGKDLLLQERLKENKNTDGRLNKQTSSAQTGAQNETLGMLQAMAQAAQKR